MSWVAIDSGLLLSKNKSRFMSFVAEHPVPRGGVTADEADFGSTHTSLVFMMIESRYLGECGCGGYVGDNMVKTEICWAYDMNEHEELTCLSELQEVRTCMFNPLLDHLSDF